MESSCRHHLLIARLLTGKKNDTLSYLPEHEKYIDKLIEILNNNDEDKKTTVKIMLDSLKPDNC